jgi:hypothetical protein
MACLSETLSKLHETILLLEARPPSGSTIVDSDLVEQNSISKIRSLVRHYYSLKRKPFLINRHDNQSITCLFTKRIQRETFKEVTFIIHHGSTGYRIDYVYAGSDMRRIYKNINAENLFETIVSDCKMLIGE